MKFSEATPGPDDLVLGIDEAGRGPVLGPMILGAVCGKWKDMPWLAGLGVKDSKKLSDPQRHNLFKNIRGSSGFRWKIITISPHEIDTCLDGLNMLEMWHVAGLVRFFQPQYVVIDSPFNPTASFNLKSYLYEQRIDVSTLHCFAENKADDLYPIVSAASIVAKEARERSVEMLRKQYDVDFGSGYPADPKTKKFLFENWNNDRYTTLVRKSWETYKRFAR